LQNATLNIHILRLEYLSCTLSPSRLRAFHSFRLCVALYICRSTDCCEINRERERPKSCCEATRTSSTNQQPHL